MKNKDSDPKPKNGQGRQVNKGLARRQAELKTRNLAGNDKGAKASPNENGSGNKKGQSSMQVAGEVFMPEIDEEFIHDPGASNFIKKFRTAQGLTRGELAERVGSSQRELYMAESGYGTPLSMAVAICDALKKPMWKIFPGTKDTLKRIPPEADLLRSLMENEEAIQKAGVELGMGNDSLKIRMRGGLERLFPISSRERRRLWEELQTTNSDADYSFVVFNSSSRRIALNPRFLLAWQFLWDAHTTTEQASAKTVCIFFPDRIEPETFAVSGDDEKLAWDGSNNDEGTALQDTMNVLEVGGCLDETLIHFSDIDGDHVFIRPTEMNLIEIPLVDLDPELREIEYEEEQLEQSE